MATDDHLILRHENARYRDILSHLVFRRRLTTSRFAEHKPGAIAGLDTAQTDWVTALTLVIQKILATISDPLRWLGFLLEFVLNFFSINGGVLGVVRRCLTFSLAIPQRESADFLSLIGHIDGRYELNRTLYIDDIPELKPIPGVDINPLSLSMMASKLSYENAAVIRNQVEKKWKMHFVRFFDCWNKYLKNRATQAFIFCDKAEDAKVIVLAFRGTEPCNALDWITDVDLSWLSLGKFGKAHLGFMRALGLQDEKDINKGFPVDHPGHHDGRELAYYAIRETLKDLLGEHRRAKILITGHSLGGALAVVFPAILAIHEQHNILNSIHGVMTYGQPRVGDAEFGRNLDAVLKSKYHRMVYRYDIVPRVPFDKPPIALFKHFGTCIYFTSWYEGKVVEESPNPNYFHPLFLLSMYLCALGDLTKAFLLGLFLKDFEESYVSLIYRASGLLIPGIASHSPRDYVNGGSLARIVN
ncbi:hypothetical protein HPP92_012624 [Vanilla planifolia]|uniref:Fungal lipase-type domain-containing protein n=1 Tax=Vanilla planifolia TaxID=51239 RepID=A0A835QP83_VANPL|nr:hypothetical protein HPP92_013035 [Vanilla planifolia]KAG0477905.1 hypothetical protein HPP92_012624 [Vanilla planifolia]